MRTGTWPASSRATTAGSGYFVDSFINFDLVGATPGDLDGDGVVGIVDFLTLLANWG